MVARGFSFAGASFFPGPAVSQLNGLRRRFALLPLAPGHLACPFSYVSARRCILRLSRPHFLAVARLAPQTAPSRLGGAPVWLQLGFGHFFLPRRRHIQGRQPSEQWPLSPCAVHLRGTISGIVSSSALVSALCSVRVLSCGGRLPCPSSLVPIFPTFEFDALVGAKEATRRRVSAASLRIVSLPELIWTVSGAITGRWKKCLPLLGAGLIGNGQCVHN